MSLVTPQGIAAQKRMDNEVAQARDDVRESVSKKPQLPKELIVGLGSKWKPVVIREAMWQLLESEELELGGDRRLIAHQ